MLADAAHSARIYAMADSFSCVACLPPAFSLKRKRWLASSDRATFILFQVYGAHAPCARSLQSSARAYYARRERGAVAVAVGCSTNVAKMSACSLIFDETAAAAPRRRASRRKQPGAMALIDARGAGRCARRARIMALMTTLRV